MLATLKRITLGTGVLILGARAALALCGGTLPCPLHNGANGTFTGTQFISGVLVGVYHCTYGHDFLHKCN